MNVGGHLRDWQVITLGRMAKLAGKNRSLDRLTKTVRRHRRELSKRCREEPTRNAGQEGIE
jgi:hypothetical protein